jgi:hypothetical protein
MPVYDTTRVIGWNLAAVDGSYAGMIQDIGHGDFIAVVSKKYAA